jgi:hypothetical protein
MSGTYTEAVRRGLGATRLRLGTMYFGTTVPRPRRACCWTATSNAAAG